MKNALISLQCAHHASTFNFNHTVLVAGDKIGILPITVMHCNDYFHNNYELCINESHEKSLKWAHEENIQLPSKEIESGVKKARVNLDLDAVIKSFHF